MNCRQKLLRYSTSENQLREEEKLGKVCRVTIHEERALTLRIFSTWDGFSFTFFP